MTEHAKLAWVAIVENANEGRAARKPYGSYRGTRFDRQRYKAHSERIEFLTSGVGIGRTDLNAIRSP